MIFFSGYIFKQNFLSAEIILYKNFETLLSVPSDFKVNPYKKISYDFDDWRMTVFSENFQRGDILYFEIQNHSFWRDTSKYQHEIIFSNFKKKVIFFHREFGFNTLYVIPPETKQKQIQFTWRILKKNIPVKENQFSFEVINNEFPENKGIIYLYKKEFSEEELQIIEKQILEEKKIKTEVLNIYKPLMIKNNLSYPLNYHEITSEWYKKRTFQYFQIRKRKKIFLERFESIHKGVDLKGFIGESVYAIADGEVIISDNFYFEGEFIVINHGNYIFSMYMHLSERNVNVGDVVRAGTLIGKVGNTGLSIGSHLHYEIRIDEFSANPLSVFGLPIR